MDNTEHVFLWNPYHEPFVRSGNNDDLPPASKAMFGCVVPIIVFLAITGLLMAGLAVTNWQHYDALAERGVVTQGQYVDYSTARATDGRQIGYTLTYTYVVNDVEYRGSAGVTNLQDALDAIGQTISVTYDPENPSLSTPGTRATTGRPVAMTVFAIIWNLVILAVGVALWRMAGASGRLRKNGQLVLGEILEFEAKEVPSNERLVQITMRYAFQSPQTQAVIERARTGPRIREGFDLSAPPEQGTPVALLYGSDRQFEIM